MSPTTTLLAIFGFFILPILGQEGHEDEFGFFRHDCSTADFSGTTITAPCMDRCSWCEDFYVSSIDLNKCVGYDGADTLFSKLDGHYSDHCTNCWTNFGTPDTLYCDCAGNDGKVHTPSLDLNFAIGTRCGRLSCEGYTEKLGPGLLPDRDNESQCGVNTADTSGNKMVVEPTPAPAPELLYVRRGLVYRQVPSNATSTTVTTVTPTVSVIITLTGQPLALTAIPGEKDGEEPGKSIRVTRQPLAISAIPREKE